ncbi:hypothetical protein LEP1GSC170_4498, partial [Leptospira interrogans serovar Bataviae str. HAI135]
MKVTDRFLKCGNYCKSRFYKQILKLKVYILRKFFLFTPNSYYLSN